MPHQSVRSIVGNCLGKTGALSVKEDVLGVYASDNPQTRSLKERLDLIETKPFVRVVIVILQGTSPSLQRDLDSANIVYLNESDHWVYCQNRITVTQTNLLVLNQNDCLGGILHSVSDEEDQLFDLGRGLGADIVCYYIITDTAGFAGCAAHPDGRRGFWVANFVSQWVFAHELTHVLIGAGHRNDTDNLMFNTPGSITNPPPDLTNSQQNGIANDRDIESC